MITEEERKLSVSSQKVFLVTGWDYQTISVANLETLFFFAKRRNLLKMTPCHRTESKVFFHFSPLSEVLSVLSTVQMHSDQTLRAVSASLPEMSKTSGTKCICHIAHNNRFFNFLMSLLRDIHRVIRNEFAAHCPRIPKMRIVKEPSLFLHQCTFTVHRPRLRRKSQWQN